MHVPGPDETLAVLRRSRPDLVDAYQRELPGARAAVLGRLWGAYAREPLPGVRGRDVRHGTLTVQLAGGRALTGPAAAAEPYAPAPPGLTVTTSGPAGDGYADPAGLARALGHDGLAAELDNSVANLALARAAAAPAGRRGVSPPGQQSKAPLYAVEQSVVDGHPLHPCCRTRLGMSTLDVLRYAPEHRPVVGLHLVRVPEDRWYGDGPPLLVLHPWQAERLLPAYPWLVPVGRRAAHPLMSLRTLALPGRAWHVKTAVDVQMTSAVRTVSPAAVRNGPALSALLRGLAVPGLAVLREDRAGAAIVDGEPSRSLAALRREAPALAPGEVAVPFAALHRVARPADPVAFFAALVRAFLPPLQALLRLGVALEAHGQNALLVLRDGHPTRLVYRDLGGVRVSPAALRAHGVRPPPLHGDLATDDPEALRAKLAAAAVSGTLAEQVAAFSRRYSIDPAVLWSIVAEHADPELRTATLPIKATTAMRLASDPLTDVWASLPNPMAGMRD